MLNTDVVLEAMFNQTKQFNDIAGNTKENTTVADLLMQVGLIVEEAQEIIDATTVKEMYDGLADTLVVSFGVMQRIGFTLNEYDLISTMKVNTSISPDEVVRFAMGVRGLYTQLEELQATHIIDVPSNYQGTIVTAVELAAYRAIAMVLQQVDNMGVLKEQATEMLLQFYDAVAQSNLSKFSKTEVSAFQTREHYASLGVTVVNEFNDTEKVWVHRVAETVTVAGKLYPKGKIMKSVDYKDPGQFLGM